MSAAAANDRSAAEVAREQALGEISDVLLNLEHTRTRAKKALQRVRKSGGEHNVELALTELIADLGQVPGSGVTADPSLYALSAMKVSATTSLSVSGRTRMRERARTSSPR